MNVIEIKNFDDTVTGYQVQLGTEVKVGDEITVYGETCGDSSIYSVKQSTVSINEYGFATGSAIVLGKAQTTDYTTSSSKICAINFSIEIETTTESTEKPNTCEIIIAKQRNGPIGTVELSWQPQLTKFANLAR